MIDEQAIQEAARMLAEAAGSAAEVILFGSRARGDADDRSDVDFLVIEPGVRSVYEEMVRLNQILTSVGLPADVIVMSREQFDYWKDTPNTLAYRVSREGRVYAKAG
jgi:predicted nucleotidyltransferase